LFRFSLLIAVMLSIPLDARNAQHDGKYNHLL